MQVMLMLVFVFMLLNLTSIWKLPTLSTGGHGHDDIPRIVGLGAEFFICGHARKAALGTIPRWGQLLTPKVTNGETTSIRLSM